MSQTSYTLGCKVAPPSIHTNKPEKSPLAGFVTQTLLITAIAFTFMGLFGLILPLLILAAALYVAWGLTKMIRKRIHKNDTTQYQQQVSDTWVASDGFMEMRDFLMLMGFTPQVAYQITDNLGTEIIINQSYAQATGYYPLSSAAGDKVISAVQVETLYSKKGNIKLKAKVLQEV